MVAVSRDFGWPISSACQTPRLGLDGRGFRIYDCPQRSLLPKAPKGRISPLPDLVSLFVGAFLGGLLGYVFVLFQDQQATDARRAVLKNLLRDELALINPSPLVYDVTKVIYRDPIRLESVSALLDGRTLDYRTNHAALATALLRFRAILTTWNDFIVVTNLAQSVAAMPDSGHNQMFDELSRRHALLIEAVTQLKPLLAK